MSSGKWDVQVELAPCREGWRWCVTNCGFSVAWGKARTRRQAMSAARDIQRGVRATMRKIRRWERQDARERDRA